MNHNREFAFWQRVNVVWLGPDRGIFHDMARFNPERGIRKRSAIGPPKDLDATVEAQGPVNR
jgi:hypothetical protein